MRAPVTVVRADANTATGLGHAMRCLALAQELEARGGQVEFLAEGAPESIRSRASSLVDLHSIPGTVEDAAETASLASTAGASWVVVDGYHFSADYHRYLIDAGTRVLVLEDHGHVSSTPANIVLNPNLGAERRASPVTSQDARHLRGARFALLRREFRTAGQRALSGVDTARPATRVLITLGGGDSENVTSRCLSALDSVRQHLEVVVVLGGANPHEAEVSGRAAASPHAVTVARDPEDMPSLMVWADVAIAAAGGTAWELVALGVPQCTVVVAENQREAAAALLERDLSVPLGWWQDLDPTGVCDQVSRLLADGARRYDMATRARAQIDSRGSARVVDAMIAFTGGANSR